MGKERLKVKVFLNFFGTYKEVSQRADITKIMYEKIDSAVIMSAMDFYFILAHSMIGKFSNRKRAAPTHRPSKKSKGESFGHCWSFA